MKTTNFIILLLLLVLVSCSNPGKEISGIYTGECTEGSTTYNNIQVEITPGGTNESVAIYLTGQGDLYSVSMHECQVRKNADGSYHLYHPFGATYELEGSVINNTITFTFQPAFWSQHTYTGTK